MLEETEIWCGKADLVVELRVIPSDLISESVHCIHNPVYHHHGPVLLVER